MDSTYGGLTRLDWTVVAAYFVGITALGLWLARKIRTSGGYFLGDRKLPWWVMMGQAFGTGTNSENPVAQAGACCQSGFATIWYQWKNMLITPFYWLMAPWYRRSERTTIAEIIEDRYGRSLAFAYMLFAIAFFVFNQGVMLKGAAKIICAATGDKVTANEVVGAMTVAFILYSFFGGLIASAYTDFIQGLLIIVLSFMLIPMGLAEVGGFAGMREVLPDNFFELYNEASKVDVFTIVMFSLNGLLGITVQPHILSMNATGRSERAGRIGQTYGSLVKRFCTIGWALTGLIVAAMVIQSDTPLADHESAFGYASLHLLGSGWIGLMVACVLAANMSTCSNFMVNAGALFTQNFYKTYLAPEASDRRLLLVGRVSGLALTLLGVLFALVVENVLQGFMFTETIAALVGIMFLGGMLWKRANRYGAAAATLVAFVVYYGLHYQEVQEIRLVYTWQAVPFGWAALAGSVVLVIVSLLTPREDPGRIAAFFDNMNRTTDDEGLPAGSEKPLAAERGQDLLFLDLPGWLTADRWRGFFRRYREDLIGFVLAWLTVGLLVLTAWGVMQIRR